MLRLALLTLAAAAACPAPAANLPAAVVQLMAEDLCSRDGTCSHVPPEPPKKP